MALPQTFDPTTPADSDSPAQGAAHLRDHVQKFIDVFGLPQSPSTVTASIMKVSTAGVWALPMRLTNQTGVGVIAGDVAAFDSTISDSVALGDVVSSQKRFVVALETIANGATGLWAFGGQVTVNTQGTVTRGHYLRKSATTKKVEDSGTAQGDAVDAPDGSLGLALSPDAGGQCTAAWWGAMGGGDQPTVPPVPSTGVTVRLPLEGATLPDASGTINDPAVLVRQISSAQATNAPKVTQTIAKFNESADQHLMWNLVLPLDYASGGTLYLLWKATSATSGACFWKASIAFSTNSSTDDDAIVFNTVTGVSSTAPGTQGQTKEAQITLTMTNAAVGRKATIFVGRDADGTLGTDDMADTAELLAVALTYVKAVV